ncbi:hypothetical protein ATANTOWER_006491 [Ataeniobius toweri]|uniref:Uncharacterized protein n=1 Tax=Ataeniobius toweri TaxID=208326 RepID=A0ABU7A1K4_9TELE|nr:hypothetical protein [Ataeniobius toweri]
MRPCIKLAVVCAGEYQPSSNTNFNTSSLGPWRGQLAAVMRRTSIDTIYCLWEVIDPTAVCPALIKEQEPSAEACGQSVRRTLTALKKKAAGQ